MRILITGASGFIGSALATALARRGHEVLRCTHRHTENSIAVDYMQDVTEGAWLPRLQGVERSSTPSAFCVRLRRLASNHCTTAHPLPYSALVERPA